MNDFAPGYSTNEDSRWLDHVQDDDRCDDDLIPAGICRCCGQPEEDCDDGDVITPAVTRLLAATKAPEPMPSRSPVRHPAA